MAAARASLPYKVSQQSNVRVLREYIGILLTQKTQLADIRAQIVAAAKDISLYSLLKTIPGIGDITAATILAEIEDIDRFSTDHQLTAYLALMLLIALVATANKLLRIIYGMWRKNEPFKLT